MLALEEIRKFFFTGLDATSAASVTKAPIDVETQAVLHLNSQVKADSPHSVKGWYSARPLCVGQADLLADDVVRLLSLKDLLPRITMVEYLKILFAFHLALGQLKTMKLLPTAVARSAADPACGHDRCPAAADAADPLAGCPFRAGLFVDVAGVPGTPAAVLAEHSAEHWLRRIPDFVRAAYAVSQAGRVRRAPRRPGQGDQARPRPLHRARAAAVRHRRLRQAAGRVLQRPAHLDHRRHPGQRTTRGGSASAGRGHGARPLRAVSGAPDGLPRPLPPQVHRRHDRRAAAQEPPRCGHRPAPPGGAAASSWTVPCWRCWSRWRSCA